MESLLDQLKQKLGISKPAPKAKAKPAAKRATLMQVNADGSHGPSNQGHLPPAQQKDTWMSDDPRAVQPRGYDEIRQSPFKMFEDNSFQGDPRQFRMDNPDFKFYEDNSFSAPRPLRMGSTVAPRVGAQWSGVQMARGLHGDDIGTAQPQGEDNPGYIPLQTSGFGGRGYAANLQPTTDPQRKRLY